MGAFLLPCTATEVSLLTVWCLIGATPRGSAVDNCRATPQGRDGLSARQMAVLYTFREPSLCRHVHRELLRSVLLNLTRIIPATTCHQRNYVERYSRSRIETRNSLRSKHPRGWILPKVVKAISSIPAISDVHRDIMDSVCCKLALSPKVCPSPKMSLKMMPALC